VKLGVDGLIPYISSIGLFNTKAKNVVALAQQLIDAHGGEVPRERDALEKLPGVGRKTANVVLNVAFGEPTIAVDTHIFRVANRTRLAVGKDPETVERQLVKFTPDEFKPNAHHWLILHGRYVCIARMPKCPQCVIADLCEYPAKTRALPDLDARALPLAPPAETSRRTTGKAPKATVASGASASERPRKVVRRARS
jgi:endonuclease-3